MIFYCLSFKFFLFHSFFTEFYFCLHLHSNFLFKYSKSKQTFRNKISIKRLIQVKLSRYSYIMYMYMRTIGNDIIYICVCGFRQDFTVGFFSSFSANFCLFLFHWLYIHSRTDTNRQVTNNWPLGFLLKVLNQLMSRQSKYLSVRLDKDFWQTNRKQETNDS